MAGSSSGLNAASRPADAGAWRVIAWLCKPDASLTAEEHAMPFDGAFAYVGGLRGDRQHQAEQ